MTSGPAQFVVRELFDVSDPAFEPALALYEATFPIDEREPHERVRARLTKRRNWTPGRGKIGHFLVCEQDGKLLGMRIHDYYPGLGLGWLVYLAVDPAARRHRIGTRLLQCGIASCKLDALFVGDLFRGAVLEVERPQDALSEEDRKVREERLMFFASHGVQKLTDTYTQPALTDDSQPVPLSLFLAGVEPNPAEHRAIVTDFMLRMWGMEPDDPLVGQALQGVDAS